MLTFYQFIMTYRDSKTVTNESQLANWIFADHDFPKQGIDYNQVSDYLEWNSPFAEALVVFDELWEVYLLRRE
ncbi:MAG TPA: YozE family protein [Virgibacillus sp.]|nr:YozE family protein [Virgibacillus sp.]